MKNLFFTILILLGLATFTEAQTFYGTDDVKIFREGREKEFRSANESPLLKEDFQNFKGLNYYPFNEKYRVTAKFAKTTGEKYFLMPTSSGRPAKYVKVGVLTFEIDGVKQSLAAYQSEYVETNPEWNKKYGHAYFIPFKDLTNGKETYSVGRYIYLKIPEGENTILDFNLTFNPSCAYGSDRYNCPIPPKENFLKVEIKAGEKSFAYSGSKKS